MKNLIFLEIMNRLRAKPKLKKKLTIFVIVGVIGFFVTSGLVIWAGLSAVRFASNQVQALNMPVQLDRIESGIKSLPTITAMDCWGKTQSLMNLESWVKQPLVDTFRQLKVSCLQEKPSICNGENCQNLKMKMNTAESEAMI